MAVSVVTAVVMSGCYAYVPTTSAVIPATTPVTIRLSLAGTAALQSTIGQGVNEVEGAIVRSSADTVVVAVENTYTSTRQKFSSSGTEAAIPRPFIEDVKVRTFSRKRTILTIAGGVGLAAVGAAAVAAGSSSSSGDGGGGVIPARVVVP
ncbi:MAG: hypothetical protein U5K74_14205 [Gemmatimonadaceae bacterium]|nr:hypothetical protein [Gemmatimonadaceae bacterium]